MPRSKPPVSIELLRDWAEEIHHDLNSAHMRLSMANERMRGLRAALKAMKPTPAKKTAKSRRKSS